MITNPILGNTSSTGVTFLQNAVPAAITMMFIVGAVVFFFILITGAIQWITSGGDKQALEGARGKISNALIGVVILFAVFAIMQLLQHFFHITILTLDISKLVIR